jgi:hypothetical protein
MSYRIISTLLTLLIFGFTACASGDDTSTDTGALQDTSVSADTGSVVDAATDEGSSTDSVQSLDEGNAPTDTAQAVDQGTSPVDEGSTPIDAGQPTNCTDLTILNETPVEPGAPAAVDIQLCNVVVTYKHSDGYFIQQSIDGPATEVYIGGDWPYPAPAEGDVLNIRVSQWSSYEGHQEITASEPPVLVAQQSLEGWALDISAGILPSESIESRLVTLSTAQVREAINSKNYLIDYGTAEAVTLYVSGLSDELCTNASFSVTRGIIIQYGDIHEIKVYYAGFDVTDINTDNCPPPIEYDSSNWGFESWTSTDPPEDFIKEKQGQNFSATQEGVHVKQGSSACVLSWFTTDTAELAQGWWMPAEAGKDYTLSLWAWDEADTGRIRTALKFYDADKNAIGSTEYSSYTDNEGAWTELTATATAPDGTVYARGAVRMYDVAGDALFDPAVGADVYIDEWNLSEATGTTEPVEADPGN